MLALLIFFLYMVCGVATAMLMARFGDYKPGETKYRRGDPPALLMVVIWPLAAFVYAAMGINYAFNKLILSARKEETNDSN